jgi:hypothetical protein
MLSASDNWTINSLEGIKEAVVAYLRYYPGISLAGQKINHGKQRLL